MTLTCCSTERTTIRDLLESTRLLHLKSSHSVSVTELPLSVSQLRSGMTTERATLRIEDLLQTSTLTWSALSLLIPQFWTNQWLIPWSSTSENIWNISRTQLLKKHEVVN